MFQAFIIGVLLAVGVSMYAWVFKLDRSPAFYPTCLIVIALLYILFAAIGGSRDALVADGLIMVVFVTLATVGHARNMWLVVAGLAGHGVMDAFHWRIVDNPGVPEWWPAFCAAYDLVAAGALALLILRRQRGSQSI